MREFSGAVLKRLANRLKLAKSGAKNGALVRELLGLDPYSRDFVLILSQKTKKSPRKG